MFDDALRWMVIAQVAVCSLLYLRVLWNDLTKGEHKPRSERLGADSSRLLERTRRGRIARAISIEVLLFLVAHIEADRLGHKFVVWLTPVSEVALVGLLLAYWFVDAHPIVSAEDAPAPEAAGALFDLEDPR